MLPVPPAETVSKVSPVAPPETTKAVVGEEFPIPTFPFASTVKSEAPDDEATLNGLSADEVDDCTLKVYDDDVALIPATVPLSISVEVPRVVDVNQRVA